jgi:hypothetical protein
MADIETTNKLENAEGIWSWALGAYIYYILSLYVYANKQEEGEIGFAARRDEK